MFKLGLLLSAVLATSLAYECSKAVLVYDWPDETNCRHYHHCDNGKLTEHSCLILFRKFNPVTLSCDWAWRVNCQIPPTPLTPTQTPLPPTVSSTPAPQTVTVTSKLPKPSEETVENNPSKESEERQPSNN